MLTTLDLKSLEVRLVVLLLVVSAVAGCTRIKEPTPLEPLWQVNFPEPSIYLQEERLTILNGVIYVVTTDDAGQYSALKLYAVDSARGVILWKADTRSWGLKGGLKPLLVAKDGLVLFKTEHESLRALDAQTGVQRWEIPDVFKLLELSGGKVHVLDLRGLYRVFEASSGKSLKTTDLRGDFRSQLVIDNGVQYFIHEDSLEATDVDTEKLLWRQQVPKSDLIAFEIRASGGLLYIAVGDRVTALDGKTGQKLWERPHRGVPPVIENDRAYLGEPAGDESVVELNARTGELIRTIPLSGGTGSDNDLVIEHGVLYAPDLTFRAPLHTASSPSLPEAGPDPGRDYYVKVYDLRKASLLGTTKSVYGKYITKPTPTGEMFCMGLASADMKPSARLLCYRANAPQPGK